MQLFGLQNKNPRKKSKRWSLKGIKQARKPRRRRHAKLKLEVRRHATRNKLQNWRNKRRKLRSTKWPASATKQIRNSKRQKRGKLQFGNKLKKRLNGKTKKT